MTEKKRAKPDLVNHPAHYARLDPEPIEVINSWKLGWELSNVLKYIARAGYKGDALQDLEKAGFYLKRAITLEERKKKAEVNRLLGEAAKGLAKKPKPHTGGPTLEVVPKKGLLSRCRCGHLVFASERQRHLKGEHGIKKATKAHLDEFFSKPVQIVEDDDNDAYCE